MKVRKFRKKPVEAEAIEWDGLRATYNELLEFMGVDNIPYSMQP